MKKIGTEEIITNRFIIKTIQKSRYKKKYMKTMEVTVK